MKRKLISLLLTAVLLCTASVPALAAPGNISDLEGHWAQAEIETAINERWVNGYPDGTFRPQGTITRAEFTKMLLAAVGLSPESETVLWMKDHAYQREQIRLDTVPYRPTLVLPVGHWFTTQGWKDAAIYAGILDTMEYTEYDFRPDQSITRYEIAVLTVRAMGLVYPAKHAATGLPFPDLDTLKPWVRGYIQQAANAGVLTGYPDGSFGPHAPATRAEAVVMVSRVLNSMEEGLDPNIQINVRYDQYTESADEIQLQQVGDILYVNLLDVCSVHNKLRWAAGDTSITPEEKLEVRWVPLEQTIEYGPNSYCLDKYQAGNPAFLYNYDSYTFSVPPRLLYGEVLIPVYDFSTGQTNPIWTGHWDEATRTMTISISTPEVP